MFTLAQQVRAETAEYFYFVLQEKDIGRETEPIEEVLLETEWYAISAQRCGRDANTMR